MTTDTPTPEAGMPDEYAHTLESVHYQGVLETNGKVTIDADHYRNLRFMAREWAGERKLRQDAEAKIDQLYKLAQPKPLAEGEAGGCPFCGDAPYVNFHGIPLRLCCDNKECPLGPNLIISNGLGRGTYERKYMTFAAWNNRRAP